MTSENIASAATNCTRRSRALPLRWLDMGEWEGLPRFCRAVERRYSCREFHKTREPWPAAQESFADNVHRLQSHTLSNLAGNRLSPRERRRWGTGAIRSRTVKQDRECESIHS